MNDEHPHQDCLDLADRLSEYLDGELPEDLKREVENHFRACVTCEAFLRSLARVRSLGGLLAGGPLSREDLRELASRARRRLPP
jgi:anti-sigma factor RsiW